MALANVACLLARQESHEDAVLIIDWDLEAPGLHQYFDKQLSSLGKPNTRAKQLESKLGLIDFFTQLDHATPTELPQTGEDEEKLAARCLDSIELDDFIIRTDISGLTLMKAGRFDDGYASRVSTFNWEGLYNRSPNLIPLLAERLSERFRYVLIDSRTGLTDTSGICTMLMPEKLIVVFTPNHQSLSGVKDLIRQATTYRRQSEDLRPLLIFPLPSRIELSELERKKEWRFGNEEKGIEGYQPLFESLFRELYGLPKCDLNAYFDEVQIQQLPPYAYGEVIASLVERGSERLSLTKAYSQFMEILFYSDAPWTATPELSLEEASKARAEVALQKQRAEKAATLASRAKLIMIRTSFVLFLLAAGGVWYIWEQKQEQVEAETMLAEAQAKQQALEEAKRKAEADAASTLR